jgi:hypothetical protein
MKTSPAESYERDYYAWIQDQVRALRERRIEDVDWENVAEEVEDLGKSERRTIKSHIARLAEHLLKLQYAQGMSRETNARGWQLSVRGARIAIEELLEDSPSLRRQLPEMLAAAYRSGRLEALRKTRLPDEAIPTSPPWTVEQVLNENFLPSGE